MIERLAVGDHTEFSEWVEVDPEFSAHLKGYGLVRESAGTYHLTISCVQQYLVDHSLAKKKKLSAKEQRQQEVSLTRNRLEGMLRQTVWLMSVSRLGAKAAKQEVLQRLLKPSQKPLMEKLDINEMFSGSEKELYLSDLSRIISTNWEMFHPVFGSEKQKFETFIEHVNKPQFGD